MLLSLLRLISHNSTAIEMSPSEPLALVLWHCCGVLSTEMTDIHHDTVTLNEIMQLLNYARKVVVPGY